MVRDTTFRELVLLTTLTSPFGRKVRMAATVLGIADQIIIQPADTLADHDPLRLHNPLGKMPTLLLEDGTALFDSWVIIEYLTLISGDPLFFPEQGLDRMKLLTTVKLCDGITEAALLMVYEHRFRQPEQVSQRWLNHQSEKILRAMNIIEKHLPPSNKTTIVSISLACALGYLDWRHPIEWRSLYPQLADWLARYSDYEPAFLATKCMSN